MPYTIRRRHTLLFRLAALALSCAHPRPAPRALVPVRILALNDFHGQLEAGKQVNGHPAGSAPVLASWLLAARAGREGATLIVSAGDLVSSSPPTSAVLQDEPTLSFLDLLAGVHCVPLPPERRADAAALARDPRCDVVATVGNHEFERGVAELLRLVRGGDGARGPHLRSPWRGASFPFVAANVVDARTGAEVFPAAVVREVGGVRVGVVGAVLREVSDLQGPGAVEGVAFLDPADAVNRAVRALVAGGVRAIVVLLHDGGEQRAYPGPTRADAPPPSGRIAPFVARLDGEVDVVVSGHRHAFTNARLPNAAGRPVLVTQAYSAGTSFARIDLGVAPETGDVAEASAEIVPALADAGPGLTPDAQAARLVADARAKVLPLVSRVVAAAAVPVRRGSLPLAPGDPGEWALGDLVADAFRAAVQADVALVQMGALRADLPAGPITWGDLHSALPFRDTVVRVTLTGRELEAVLEQQWLGSARPSWRPEPYVLQVSGLRFTWDASRGEGERIVELTRDGAALDPDARYTVALPSALASGVDRFTRLAALVASRDRLVGPLDVAALEAYLASLPRPFVAAVDGRIARRP